MIEDNINEVITRLQAAERRAPSVIKEDHEEANKITLRQAREVAPYRTGALYDSLHATDPTPQATGFLSEIAPGEEIFYAIFLIAKGGRLDWVERTIEERPDIPVRIGQEMADSITDLYNGA